MGPIERLLDAHSEALRGAREALFRSMRRSWRNAPAWTRDEIRTFTHDDGLVTAPETVAWHDLRWR